MRMGRLTAMLVGALMLPATAQSQTLAGRVFDGVTGQAVAGAEVAVMKPAGKPVGLAVSDTAGTFHVRLEEAGRYRMVATAPGYDSVAVDSVVVGEQEEVRVELRLGPRPLEVEGFTVVARRSIGPPALQEFYERLDRHERTGRGLVLGREALARHEAQTAARALARETMNVREYVGYGGGAIMVKRLGVRFGAPPWCAPALFLDGLPVDVATIRSIPASTVAGIEFYRGAHQVPAQFMWAEGATDCGVILVWTRRDGGGPSGPVELRPGRAGFYVAAAGSSQPGRSMDVAAFGIEIERGIARSMAGWLAVGLVEPDRDVLCLPYLGDCGVVDAPWSVMVGASLFPTGDELPLAPYVGAGLGLASPARGTEVVHVVRAGLELVPGPVRFRLEVRTGSAGLALGIGALFF